MRRSVRAGVVCLIAVALLTAAAPFIGAGRFGHHIESGLREALRREVKFGKSRFSLYGGPGFVIEDVLIQEDPAAGIEPFAHVMSLEARVAVSSLWRGRLEFSRLRLVEPRVNLVKPDQGAWNIAPLLMKSGAADRMPAIEVADGRINLKFGSTKSPFYLTNAQLDVTARGGGYDVRFTGEPGRTDRPARGFGVFSVRGRWTPGSAESNVDLLMELEKTAIVELSELLSGRDYGLHGLISSQARVTGPASNMRIEGDLAIEDIHRWDLMPGRRGSGWRLKYEGVGDWRAQKLEVAATPKRNPGMPLAMRLRVLDVLNKRARWVADVTASELPAAAVLEVAGHLGANLPSNLQMEGRISGVAGYSPAGGLQGRAILSESALQVQDQFRFMIPRAEILLSGADLRIGGATVESGERTALVDAAFSGTTGETRIHLQSDGLRITETRAAVNALLNQPPPLFPQLSAGSWNGDLHYTAAGGEPSWNGEFTIRNADARVPGIEGLVRIAGAGVRLDGEAVTVTRLRGRARQIDFDGDYRYDPREKRPHRVRLNVPLISASDLELLLAPALRREQSFLARTLRRSVELPEWLASRHAAGSLRIARLSAGGSEWENVRSAFTWDGAEIDVTALEATRGEGGSLSGAGSVLLAGSAPRYRFKGQVRDFPWRTGEVDLTGSWETTGAGLDALLNLQSKGSFQARSIALVTDAPVRSMNGDYVFEMSRDGPRVSLHSIEAAFGADRYSGRGETQAGGRLQIDLTSGTRAMRIAGSILPLKLDIVTARP